MTKTEFKCPCGASVTCEVSNNVGEMRAASGFEPCFHNYGSLIWLCQNCVSKVEQGLEILRSVFGDQVTHVNLYQLGVMIEKRIQGRLGVPDLCGHGFRRSECPYAMCREERLK